MRKEVSLTQIEVNRQNALKSTGPRTPEGKAVARLNSTKHGLFSKEIVNKATGSGETVRAFNKLLKELIQDFAPVGKMESLLVERIATIMWRLRRVLRAEVMATNSPRTSTEMPDVRIIEVHKPEGADPQIWRELSGASWEQLVDMVGCLRKDLKSAETAFKVEQGIGPKAITKPPLPTKIDLDKISRYEAALERQLSKATDQLLRLQSRRRGDPIPPSLNVTIENT